MHATTLKVPVWHCNDVGLADAYTTAIAKVATLFWTTSSAPPRDGIEKAVVGAVIADPDGRVLLLHRPADSSTTCGARSPRPAWPWPRSGTASAHFDYPSGSGCRTRQHFFAPHHDVTPALDRLRPPHRPA
ncbi:hypothetical protein AB0K89_10190 [Streptomyces cinnamoneus]|uniref:hypothetical protein n=1 Tax=Streptomyces cinnamoneus TaxID=53446 RepID=UPI00342E688B